jgi:large subunit ribosomal protein L5e
LQGALDGGLDIPHNEKRFVGYAKGDGLDPEILSKYIYGGHVAEYMENMADEEPEKYRSHFSQFIAAGIDSESMEDTYKAVSMDPLVGNWDHSHIIVSLICVCSHC